MNSAYLHICKCTVYTFICIYKNTHILIYTVKYIHLRYSCIGNKFFPFSFVWKCLCFIFIFERSIPWILHSQFCFFFFQHLKNALLSSILFLVYIQIHYIDITLFVIVLSFNIFSLSLVFSSFSIVCPCVCDDCGGRRVVFIFLRYRTLCFVPNFADFLSLF